MPLRVPPASRAGFIAKNTLNHVTTLKRNGSDYSATIIGALFRVRLLWQGASRAAAAAATAAACCRLPAAAAVFGALFW